MLTCICRRSKSDDILMSVKKLNGQFHQLMQKEEWTDMDQFLDLCIASKPSVDVFSPSPFLLFEPSGDTKAVAFRF